MRYAIKNRVIGPDSDLLGLADQFLRAMHILNEFHSRGIFDVGIWDYEENKFIDP